MKLNYINMIGNRWKFVDGVWTNFFSALLFLSVFVSRGLGADSAERFKRVEGGSSSIRFSTMVLHPSGRKIYAGQSNPSNPLETGLWVFDIDKLGDVTSSEERSYPLLPPGALTWSGGESPYPYLVIYCMRLSKDGRKLYMGLMAYREKLKPLVVQDLDEKGEPVGKPRAYSVGETDRIFDVLLHPKEDVLYTVGVGLSYAHTLVKGEPTSDPVGFSGNCDFSLVPSENWEALIVGRYSSEIKVFDVAMSGEVEKNVPGVNDGSFKFPDCPVELKANVRLYRIGHCLFFSNENMLFSWTLDKDWRPLGKAKSHPEIRTGVTRFDVHSSQIVVVGDNLYVASYESDTNEVTKEKVSTGFRILKYKPDAKGNLGKPVLESPFFEKASCSSMVVDEKTGNVYINYN